MHSLMLNVYDHRTNWLAFALLSVFQSASKSQIEQSKPHPLRDQQKTVNPKSGKLECVFVNLEAVYPNLNDPMAAEFSFEELRARHRGWMDYDWAAIRKEEQSKANQGTVKHERSVKHPTTKVVPLAPKHDVQEPIAALAVGIEENLVLNDENTPPSQADIEKAKLARKARREERANRTRKIRVMKEVRAETQTSK